MSSGDDPSKKTKAERRPGAPRCERGSRPPAQPGQAVPPGLAVAGSRVATKMAD